MMRPHVVLIPGWRDSGPQHWQTLWQKHLPSASRVVQHDWERPVREDWVDAVARHLEPMRQPIVLVAHSLGCITVASLPDHVLQRVSAALLVAPADVERSHAPDVISRFGPIPMRRLPFRSTLVASANDPYCSLRRASELAEAWGSRVIVAGNAGHINADSGHGEWPEGLRRLSALRRAVRWPSTARTVHAANGVAMVDGHIDAPHNIPTTTVQA